jgi:hypothetical protein
MKKIALFSALIALSACMGTQETNQLATRYQEKMKPYEGKTVSDVTRFKNSTHSNWQYVNDVTATTRTVESYAFTRAVVGKNRYGKRLVLGVSCEADNWYEPFSVYVRVDQVVDNWTAYRFNDSAPVTAQDSVWQGYDGATLSSGADKFIQTALSKDYVYVQMSMYSENDIEAKFSLSGFNAAFEKVYRDCWIARQN